MRLDSITLLGRWYIIACWGVRRLCLRVWRWRDWGRKGGVSRKVLAGGVFEKNDSTRKQGLCMREVEIVCNIRFANRYR
jgi:hypothetical protein